MEAFLCAPRSRELLFRSCKFSRRNVSSAAEQEEEEEKVEGRRVENKSEILHAENSKWPFLFYSRI